MKSRYQMFILILIVFLCTFIYHFKSGKFSNVTINYVPPTYIVHRTSISFRDCPIQSIRFDGGYGEDEIRLRGIDGKGKCDVSITHNYANNVHIYECKVPISVGHRDFTNMNFISIQQYCEHVLIKNKFEEELGW